MLRHIVMFRMKDYTHDAKKERVAELKSKLESLDKKIPEVKHLEVGKNVNTKPTAFDLALVTDFENEASLDVYRKHPEHVKVLEFIKASVKELAVVDYEL